MSRDYYLLSGIWNAIVCGAFMKKVQLARVRARYFGQPFAILMTDLDLFKKKNDTYAHSAGDAILKESAERIRGSVRPTDLVRRYGASASPVRRTTSMT